MARACIRLSNGTCGIAHWRARHNPLATALQLLPVMRAWFGLASGPATNISTHRSSESAEQTRTKNAVPLSYYSSYTREIQGLN